MRRIEKLLTPFLMVSTFSITMQCLRKIEQRTPAGCAKIWCYDFREIALKNCEKSINRRKRLCAPLRIQS